jgi:hypothetical protein
VFTLRGNSIAILVAIFVGNRVCCDLKVSTIMPDQVSRPTGHIIILDRVSRSVGHIIEGDDVYLHVLATRLRGINFHVGIHGVAVATTRPRG